MYTMVNGIQYILVNVKYEQQQRDHPLSADQQIGVNIVHKFQSLYQEVDGAGLQDDKFSCYSSHNLIYKLCLDIGEQLLEQEQLFCLLKSKLQGLYSLLIQVLDLLVLAPPQAFRADLTLWAGGTALCLNDYIYEVRQKTVIKAPRMVFDSSGLLELASFHNKFEARLEVQSSQEGVATKYQNDVRMFSELIHNRIDELN